MVDFKRRHRSREYMDEASAAGEDLVRALRELELVNRFLGGTRASIDALFEMVPEGGTAPLYILDLGMGAGDIPAAIAMRARRRAMSVKIAAVDFNPAVCAWARKRWAHIPEVEFLQADVFALPFTADSFDIVHSAMFLHHFPQTEAAHLFDIMYDLCRCGVIINDLHRHALAYYSIKWLTSLFSHSAMVRHDGPLSVLRGFSRPDLEDLGNMAGINRANAFAIEWRWAFRYVLSARK